MGQVKNKPTREEMLLKLNNVKGEHFLHITEKWDDENQISITEYKKILADSVFIPCPSGWGGAAGLKDCFRLYETLEAGSIPIIEKDEHLYFDSFFPKNPLLKVSNDWREVDETINHLLDNPEKLNKHANEVFSWWSKYKKNLKQSIKNRFSQDVGELAIVVQSCDSYEFLWEGWKHYFLKNWDFSIPAKVYFCTEEKDFHCENVLNIKTGKQEEDLTGAKTFSGRLKNAIGQLKEKYILYLQEDMWPHKPINKNLFLECYKYFKEKKLNAFNFGHKLSPNRKFQINGEIFSIDDFKKYTDIYIDGNQVYDRLCSVANLSSSNPFCITHHSCLFKKDFMQKYLCVKGETPIENELNSSLRIHKDHLNMDAKIQGINHKWYEHTCGGGKINQAGQNMINLLKPINRQNKDKAKEFIDLKNQWLIFFNNDRFGKHRKLFDWVKYLSLQIPMTQQPEDKFNCFNPFKKIAIVSLYTKEISEFAIYSEKNIKDYCEKQGYSFYVYRESLDKNASPNWSKSQALLNHIDDHDYIVWMDSDTLIFNPEKKLESIIEKAPKKFILATKDIGDHCMLNSGVLFFKSHQYTKNLITKWRDFNGDKSSLYASGGDQEILCEILRKSDGFGFNRKIFEMNEFNTDPRLVNEDSFILHFMAYPYELKKIFMSYWQNNFSTESL